MLVGQVSLIKMPLRTPGLSLSYFGPGNVAFGKESLKFGDILINEISVHAMFLELHFGLLHSPSMGEGILEVLF